MNTRKLLCICILNLIHLLNYTDRYTLSGILPDVQEYYGIDNEWAGLLQTAFIVSFITFAPFCGYLGDRYNRKSIILTGLFVWACAVLGSSFIPREFFWAFMTLRGLIGIGEASYVMITPTMISDMYAGDMRSRMLMLFFYNIPIGSGLGYIISSYVTSLAKGKKKHCMDCWQWGVRVVPVFGFICIIILFMFVHEPVRGESEREANPLVNCTSDESNKNRNATSMRDHFSDFCCDLRYLFTNATFIWSTIGDTTCVFASGTLSWWTPTAILHAQADSIGLNKTADLDNRIEFEISSIFGGITIAAGLIGVSLGTIFAMLWKSGKLCLKASPKANPFISGFGSFLAAPLMYFAFYTISPKDMTISWLIFFFTIMCICMNWAIQTDMLMNIIVLERRSIAITVQTLSSHLFGDASGPFIVGAISDLVRGRNATPKYQFDSLITAFYLPSALLLISGAAFVMASFTLPTALQRVAESKNTGTNTETAREPVTTIPIEGSSANGPKQPVIDRQNDAFNE